MAQLNICMLENITGGTLTEFQISKIKALAYVARCMGETKEFVINGIANGRFDADVLRGVSSEDASRIVDEAWNDYV